VVPALARELAAGLSVLFERDCEIVRRLSDAQRRLRDANERLWSGLSPDVVLSDALRGGREAAVLGVLAQTQWTIDRAFHDYQWACEERRQLAVEVGELSQQLTGVLCAAGWSAGDARRVDVHKLAGAPR